jgi:hypothetical protein
MFIITRVEAKSNSNERNVFGMLVMDVHMTENAILETLKMSTNIGVAVEILFIEEMLIDLEALNRTIFVSLLNRGRGLGRRRGLENLVDRRFVGRRFGEVVRFGHRVCKCEDLGTLEKDRSLKTNIYSSVMTRRMKVGRK